MSDSYQAIYDAVRSRITNADVGSAVESVLREANFSHYAQMACASMQEASYSQERPSVLYRPRISIDGPLWMALYGENIQEGVAGFGDSVSEAMNDFDQNWIAKLSQRKAAS